MLPGWEEGGGVAGRRLLQEQRGHPQPGGKGRLRGTAGGCPPLPRPGGRKPTGGEEKGGGLRCPARPGPPATAFVCSGRPP